MLVSAGCTLKLPTVTAMSNESDSDDAGGMLHSPSITLNREWTIKVSGSKRVWSPDIQEKNELKFMRIHKFCRSLTYFCLGKGLDMRAGKQRSCNTKSFDELLELRRAACQKAVIAAKMFQQDGVVDEDEKKKASKYQVKEEDKDMLAQPFVTIDVPTKTYHGRTFGPLSVRVLYGIKDPDLWIEFHQDTLLWLRAAFSADHAQGNSGRTRVKKK